MKHELISVTGQYADGDCVKYTGTCRCGKKFFNWSTWQIKQDFEEHLKEAKT